MTQHLTIVTGSSRGLGLALAEQLLARGHRVLALSRAATQLPVPVGAELLSWQADLADPVPVAARLAAWLATQDPATLASATLINNAGVVVAPAPLSGNDVSALSSALRVGLEAPLLLTAAFLRATESWPLPRKVLMISSGLGRRAMAGSAAYCAAKAGMDNLTRAMALDEAERPDGAAIVSLAPGIIDTDMQRQLRAADPRRFPDHAVFVNFNTTGQLLSVDDAATQVLRYLARGDFGRNVIADVRDA